MATSFFWVTSIFVAISTLSLLNGETVSILAKKREGQPQEMVEIIELMLSHRPNDSENNGFGIQKVPQENSPNYEILITPNKNIQELKGSQKIKIFVEATNYQGDEKTSEIKKTSLEPAKDEKPNIFDVLPLSIENIGSNLEQNHHKEPEVVKLNHHEVGDEFSQKDFESFPSKRQTNWGNSQKSRSAGKPEPKISNRQIDVKETIIQREPSYVDQNNPYHPVSSPVNEERSRVPTYDGDYSSSSQNGKRITHQTFAENYNPVEVQARPQGRSNPKRNYENVYEEKQVYEEPRRPAFREPEESRPSYHEEDYVLSESRNPGYNERRPRPSNEKRPIYDGEHEEESSYIERRPVSYEEESSNQRNPIYKQPEDSRPSRRPAYEKGSSDDYDGKSQDSYRPVREDSSQYSGFPESHQPDINHHYSRPLQYEPARAFPASPCLNVFKYEGREPEEDRWYADIYVTTDEVLNGLRLDIRLDKPAEILTNWLADVKTQDSMHFTLLSLTHRLVPGPPETVRIMVKFNGKKPVPYLKSINLNGRLICPSNRAQKTTTRRPVYENPGDLATRRTTETYQEGPKRPLSYVEEYQSTTKRPSGYNERTTSLYEESNRKTTVKPPPEYLRPNPNGYEETDLNTFGSQTKKPPGRPAHSNGKPPPHAAKPAQGVKPGNSQGHGQGPNKNPLSSSGSKPSSGPTVHQGVSQKPIACGIPSIQPSPLITHGQLTSRGQWPWHVALYKNVGTDLNFFCGGSLINKNYVLTAAHCVTKTYTTKPLDENTLVVYLGKYHLKLWSEGGVQNRQVSKIYVHPKYNSTDFRSDIAVLALSSPVEYTDYIRPICLWDRSNTRIEDVEGREGTVVGWGFDETKKLTEELRQAKMPVIEQKACLWSYPDFYPQFTSNMTYCAGFKNGTSVCNGDSGGGMVFPYRDAQGVERWHLRGIVSISPARNDSRVCDPTHYVVFTDVAKFLPWLDNFV